MARAARGDCAAFDRLVGRHQDALYHYLWRMIPAEAEDLAQE